MFRYLQQQRQTAFLINLICLNFQIEEQAEARPRDLAQVTGLLIITLAGVILAFLCSVVEFHKHIKILSKKHKQSYGKIFCAELTRSFASRTKTTVYTKKSKKVESVELI